MRGPIHLAVLLAVLLISVVGLALAGGAPVVRADPATGVAVTSIATHGVDAAAVPSFTRSLTGGLAAGGLVVIDAKKVEAALKPHAGLQGCETTVCLRRIGMLLQVPLCGKATVEMSGTTTFRIEVVLTASNTGKQIARVERRCELCTLKEARESLSQAAADAAKKTAGVPGLVPPRNKVRPLPRRRRVVARRTRPKPVKPRFRLVDQGKPWRRWGVVAMGAGVAALIPGIVLVALHGKDTGAGPPTADRQRWNTMAGGAALVAIGAAATIAGTTMLIVGLLSKNKRVPMVSVSWDGRSKSAVVTGFFRF